MNLYSEEYATKGEGKAIHISRIVGGDLATLCDSWGSDGGMYFRKGRVRPIYAEAATCKKCIASASKAVQS